MNTHLIKEVRFKSEVTTAIVYDEKVFIYNSENSSPIMKSKFSEFGLIKSILKRTCNPVQFLKPRTSAVSIAGIFHSPVQTSKTVSTF